MALVINTNNSSITAQKNLFWTQDQQSITFQRLATGLRVNSARDDAAGLYVITKQTTDIIGLNQATKNAGDGIAFAQTAEGAIAQITKNLQRIAELATQAGNDTYDTDARKSMQAESTELAAEAARIIRTTEFNGQDLFKLSSISFQVGFRGNSNHVVTLKLKEAMEKITGALGKLLYTEGIGANPLKNDTFSGDDKVKLMKSTDARKTIELARDAISQFAAVRSELGVKQKRFESVISNNLTYNENLQAARSRIQDTDYAVETANLARQQVLQQAGMAVLSQSNAATQSILGLLR